jgi:hypothetical protein
MSSDALAIFLLFAAAAFAVAAYLLWSRRDFPDSAAVISKENNITAEKSGGSRIGACLALVALTSIAQLVCGIIYLILFDLFGLIGHLPEFLVWVLAFAFYPLVLFAIYYPAAKFLPWAAECAERICPTRKGLRYVCYFVFESVCFLINVFSWIFLKSAFQITELFPLLYAFVFYCILKSI